MSLISGRRRSATVRAGADCIVIETPRRTMNKLISSVDDVKKVLDQTFILRTIQQKFAPNTPLEVLRPVAENTSINQFAPGEVIFSQGDEGDNLHFIRSGSVTVSSNVEGREMVMSYVPANQSVGEMALLGDTTRSATVKATVKTETLSISRESFEALLGSVEGLRERMQQLAEDRNRQNIASEVCWEGGDILSFLMGQGLGEATDVLLIDQELCVSCDFCEQLVQQHTTYIKTKSQSRSNLRAYTRTHVVQTL